VSVDKRSVHTDALATLGTIIDDTQARDAIHLAVEPVIAAHNMDAGAHVGLLDDGRASEFASKHLGIVDPFLTDGVVAGERFWLVVYPRQITSLRHVWVHPDFAAPPETTIKVEFVDSMSPSEKWIRDFADRVSLHYDVVMDGARDWVDSKKRGEWGEYLCFGGLLEGESVPEAFWPHYEAVTGEQVHEDHRGSFFTCSC
jgi:hypothetical protein